jgi:hypothetical protein
VEIPVLRQGHQFPSRARATQPAVSGVLVVSLRATRSGVAEINFSGPPGIAACDIKTLTIIP